MTKLSNYWPGLAATAIPLMLISCAQPEQAEDAPDEQTQAAQVGGETSEDAASTAPDAPVQMPVMTQTGWRVQGEDGAVYTTFFDPDGTYRDFKNGEPMQVGTWEERVDGKLCFTPAAEGRIGECWKLNPMTSDGMMKPVSDDGKAIELREVTYIAPEEEG